MPKAYPLPEPGQPISDPFQLGPLCNYGHEWDGTGHSLRYVSGKHSCVICSRQFALGSLRRRMTEDPDAVRAYRRNYMANHRAVHGRESRSSHGLPHRFLQDHGLNVAYASRAADLLIQGHAPNQIAELIRLEDALQSALHDSIGKAGRYPTIARLVMDEQRRYWQDNPEAKREHDKRWKQQSWWLRYQINPELRLYIRQKSKRRKAVMRNSVAIQLTGAQVRQRFEQFGHACAYCGATGDLHIEHVIPISKGGTHALGNVVPACADCNYSKHVGEVETWYRAQSFFTEQRWRKICRVLSWDRGSVGQLALL